MRGSTLILYRFAKRYRFALGFNPAEGAAPKKEKEKGKNSEKNVFLCFRKAPPLVQQVQWGIKITGLNFTDMPVKIRLQRKGRKKAPFYHIVIADSRAPRDGKYIQRIGTYNPLTVPATINVDRNAAFDWLMKGAQPTDTVRAILKFKGVFYEKHLQRGVANGALTQEQADDLLARWIEGKEAVVESRREQTKQRLEKQRQMIFGTPHAKPEPKVEEAPEATEVEASTEEGTDAEA